MINTAYLELLLGNDISPLGTDITDFLIIESVNSFLFVLQITVKDRNNLIIGGLVLSGNDEIKARVSPDSQFTQIEEYRYELFSIRDAQLSSPLDATTTILKLTAWPFLWKELFQGDKVRSFGSISASNVIRSIVCENTNTETEIEDSVDRQSYVQAQWTDAQMIRHLAKHAYNGDIGGYWYFFDRYLKFYFCTPNWLWSKGIEHRLEFVEEASNDNIRILAWKLISNYKTLLLQSGYGSDIKFYDYELKSYQEQNILYTDLNVNSLAKFVYLEQEEISRDRTRSVYLGSKNEEVTTPGTYKIINRVSSLFNLEVLIPGNSNVKLGQAVYVYLLADNKAIEIMDSLSGAWLIIKIVHRIETQTNQYTQKVVLARDSINSRDKQGLVKAKLGSLY